MMCAQRGYPCVITMAEPFSVERRKLMRMLGARVVVTPKAGKGTGMVEKARELAELNGWYGDSIAKRMLTYNLQFCRCIWNLEQVPLSSI